MRVSLIFVFCVWGRGALAHPGHIADLAGHGHWVAGAAIGAAIALGVWEALKGRGKSDPAPEADTDTEEEATA